MKVFALVLICGVLASCTPTPDPWKPYKEMASTQFNLTGGTFTIQGESLVIRYQLDAFSPDVDSVLAQSMASTFREIAADSLDSYTMILEFTLPSTNAIVEEASVQTFKVEPSVSD